MKYRAKPKTINMGDETNKFIVSTLKTDKRIRILGIGDLHLKKMKQRKYYNPKTDKEELVKQRNKVSFTPHPKLKKKLK